MEAPHVHGDGLNHQELRLVEGINHFQGGPLFPIFKHLQRSSLIPFGDA